jgi:hypothetical protein
MCTDRSAGRDCAASRQPPSAPAPAGLPGAGGEAEHLDLRGAALLSAGKDVATHGRDRDRTAAHAVGIVDQQYHHGNLRLTETPQVAGGGKVRRIDDCRGRGANLHGCHALPSIEGWADGRGPLRRAGPAHTFLTARQSIRVDLDTPPGDDFAAADIAAKCVHRFVSAGRQSPRAIEAGIDCSTGAIAQIADRVPTAIGTVILSLSRNGPMRPRMKASLASKASSVATSARS